ncbi:MAG: alpha-L-rhamnosidase N-terminal domain-containing protein [Kiritimatiellae bacterium]|nr:alpha-L-rhamnosidase N-terminal domain-containing protein [Kiritimatiellia bacterium]
MKTSKPRQHQANSDAWGQAQWIWLPPDGPASDVHALARKCFALDRAVRSARCRISANSSYELYVNGVWVGRGPIRSWPSWQYFDEYDLTALLSPGRNVLAVHAYHHGTEHIGALEQFAGPGGLLVHLTATGEDGRRQEVVSDASWRLCRHPAYAIEAGFVTWHRQDYKETFDARLEPVRWREACFDDGDWKQATVVGSVPCEAWPRLLPRPFPPFTRETVRPVNVFGHLSGCAYGFTPHDIRRPEALTLETDAVTEIEPLHEDFEVQLMLDFGRTVVGRFHLEIEDCGGGEVWVSYGESLNLTRVDRLILRPGSQHWQPCERRLARYALLTFRNLRGVLKLRRAWFELTTYPVREAGAFKCSDARLNRIWETGRWTLRLNMHDHFEDCPWREQTLYSGDLRVSALLAYHAFGDYALARESLIKMARIQRAEGVIPNHGPVPCNWKRWIPEYTALWVMALDDYWMHSGDRELINSLWPNAKAALAWYRSWRDERGLMRQLPGDSRADFVDNLAGIRQDGQVLAVQCFYYMALKAAERLADVAKDPEAGVAARGAAEALHAAVNALFWNESLHGYADCLPERGEAGRHATADVAASERGRYPLSAITNGLVLYAGLAPPERRKQVEPLLPGGRLANPARSGYMNYYLAEVLFGTGRAADALKLIRDYWGGMLDRGATTFWEVFDPETPGGQLPDRMWSLCHEFCCGPVHSLPRHVLGVQPREAGFRKVLIEPLTVDLTWAEGCVPTPLGDIGVTWRLHESDRRLELAVAHPAGMAVEVALPASAAVTKADGGQVTQAQDGSVRLRFCASPRGRTRRLAANLPKCG